MEPTPKLVTNKVQVPNDKDTKSMNGLSETADAILEAVRDKAKGPFQQSTLGEMISKAGNHSFNCIFCSLFSSPSLTLPPFSLFISVSTWLQFRARRLSLCHPPYGFFSLSFLVFLSIYPSNYEVFLIHPPNFFLHCVHLQEQLQMARKGMYGQLCRCEHVCMFSNGHVCCADAQNL